MTVSYFLYDYLIYTYMHSTVSSDIFVSPIHGENCDELRLPNQYSLLLCVVTPYHFIFVLFSIMPGWTQLIVSIVCILLSFCFHRLTVMAALSSVPFSFNKSYMSMNHIGRVTNGSGWPVDTRHE